VGVHYYLRRIGVFFVLFKSKVLKSLRFQDF